MTPASGTATATEAATSSATARVSRPAPTRRLASPASIAAPGLVAAPPTTRTCPRAYFDPPADGSGHSRNVAGVIDSTRSAMVLSGVVGDGRAEVLEVGDVVVDDGSPAGCRTVLHELGHGQISQRTVTRDLQQLSLPELLADVAEQHDDRVVRHHHESPVGCSSVEVGHDGAN